MAAGMLPQLFNQQPLLAEQQAEDAQLMRLAQDPRQANAYTAYAGAKQAGEGLGQIIGGTVGADTRSPGKKQSDAIQAAKQQVSQLGFNPDDPNSVDAFYKQVMQILQKQGLASEAMQVAHEWNAEKLAQKNMDLKNRDLARKASFDSGRLANAQKRNEILAAKNARDPETLQLLDQLDTLDPNDPADKPRYDAIMARVNALGASKNIKFVNLNDRIAIYDTTTNKEIGSAEKGATPMSEQQTTKNEQLLSQWQTKYDQTHLSLQQNYDNAVELYGMPGLKEATGVVAGLISKGQVNQQSGGFLDVLNRARLSASGRAAVAKIAQVQGQTFIAALSDLKSQSSTGASGLGSLTEVEGTKIQNAKAALDPQQGYDSYRANLAQYIRLLEQSSGVIDGGAQRLELKTKPLATKALGASSAAPSPTSASAPGAAPAPAGGRVPITMPDGKTYTVPRAQLEAAKAQGAVELQ